MQFTTETKVGLFVLVAACLFGGILYNIGALRFYRTGQVQYTISSSSAHGLLPKADVKIAGVTVGTVTSIAVPAVGSPATPGAIPSCMAAIQIAIDGRYQLYADAQAIIAQDGMLGPRSIDLIPGTPGLVTLPPESTIAARPPASAEALLHQVHQLTNSVAEVVQHVKTATGQQEGQVLAAIMAHLAQTSQSVEQLTALLQQTVAQNHETFTATMQQLHELVRQLKESMPLAVNNVAQQLQATAATIEQVATQAKEGVQQATAVMSHVNNGQGLLGKLVHDEQIYQDLCVASQGLKKYFKTVDSITVTIDFHSESMFRAVDAFQHPDSKGYLDVKLFTGSPYYYVVQMVGSVKGWPQRSATQYYFLQDGKQISPSSLVLNNGQIIVADHVSQVKMKRNSQRFGVQLGRVFGDAAARVGLFDGVPGIGLDYILPFSTDDFRWVTTVECYDFYGQNRFLPERRPHLKWINRLFFLKNLYITFGADDFISSCCANGFIGVGFKFSDEDLKYFASQFAVLRS
ncbi:MlaD family protein [Candidatus Dependentiae bacterium]|nr:MlaD family protein [Candidatus Dependentiae bacterium]